VGVPVSTLEPVESLFKVGDGEQKECLNALEGLTLALERIQKELDDYNEEQKKASPLGLDVKVALKEAIEWGTLVAQGKIPEDLVVNIKRKTSELDQSIQAEQIRLGRITEQKLDLTQFFSKLQVKKPMDYYNDGKMAIVKKQWLVAKENFLKYQYFANAKRYNNLPKELEGIELKDPHDDKHLEYLEVIQKKLDDIGNPVDPELLALWTISAYSNTYTKAKEEWRKTFPFRTTAPPLSSRQTSVVPTNDPPTLRQTSIVPLISPPLNPSSSNSFSSSSAPSNDTQ